MKLSVKSPSEMRFIGRKIEKEIRRTLTAKLVLGLQEFHRSILDTPVYTGRTLINYRWSVGEPITDRRAAVRNPTLPGKTSSLGVGSEPRRAANAAVINAEFAGLLGELKSSQNPFRQFYLRNNMPNFDDIEYGFYSKDSRTPPGGMVRRGEAKIKLAIRGIEKVG